MNVLYSEIRDQLKTGDLMAWKTTKINGFFDFVLFLYQKMFRARYSHVGIVVRLSDRYFVLEAIPPVVRLHPISLKDSFYLIRNDLKVSSANLDTLLVHLGKKYSVWDFVRRLFGLGNTDTELYCSELAAMWYFLIGFIRDEDAGFSPDTLVDAVLQQSHAEPVYVINDKGNLDAV